ncbi:MAG: ribonuclease Y, partial [Lachnospiraceae bacterium]
EGRNIRTLETMTGVDLIIDDTPEAVILSGFDPVRREVARIALEKLIVDGRIHPARIEEMVEKAQKEVETMMREEGEAATLEVGVHGIHPELVRLLGKMKFRTSYGQNALKHSIEVAHLSGLLAGEIGVDIRMAKRAGLLHDIGKALDHEMEGSHIQIGVDLCKRYKESDIVINAVEAHHGDVEPQSLIACIVQAADAISAARPGARRETLETYTNRLKQLEDITNSFEGVDKSFAIQAGREVRIMVVPEAVDDAEMVLLARDISKKIEAELEYPGQIKVSLIRESRVIDYAK